MNAMRVNTDLTNDGFIVLDACHRDTLAMLDRLSTLVTRLELEGLTPDTCTLATQIAAFFSTTAREHHEDEERHLFPALIATGQPEIVQAVLRLQQDHDWLEEYWFDLAPQVLAVASGQRSYDLEAMRDSVPVLTALYHDHIELEESYIYPEARARLSPSKRGEMGREMAARHRADRAARRRAGGAPA